MKNKVVRFLLSLVIALGIWLYVVTVVSPESEAVFHQIPVILESENVLAERNLIIVSGKNFMVDVKLIGNRVDLKKLTPSNITVSADLSQITEPGEHNVRYSVSYPSIVDGKNIEVLEKSPQYITLSVAERGWKEVPVQVGYGDSRVPDGYVVDRQNPKFDHSTITVSGPKATLEYVHYAKIQVSLTGKVATIVDTFRPILCDAAGNALEGNRQIPYVDKLTMNISTVKATIEIYKIKEIPLVVEVIPGGGLTEKDVVLQKSLQSLTVTGSDEVLEQLDQIVVGQIHLAQWLESGSQVFDIVVPSGIKNMTGVTQVTVDVTLPEELATKSFIIAAEHFQFINKPNDRDVVPVTKALMVTIRGTQEALAELTAEDILVIIDCSDAANMSNGSVLMNIVVEITEETSCGAVGVYQVILEVGEVKAGD